MSLLLAESEELGVALLDSLSVDEGDALDVAQPEKAEEVEGRGELDRDEVREAVTLSSGGAVVEEGQGVTVADPLLVAVSEELGVALQDAPSVDEKDALDVAQLEKAEE